MSKNLSGFEFFKAFARFLPGIEPPKGTVDAKILKDFEDATVVLNAAEKKSHETQSVLKDAIKKIIFDDPHSGLALFHSYSSKLCIDHSSTHPHLNGKLGQFHLSYYTPTPELT